MNKNKGDEIFEYIYNEYIFNRELSSVANVINNIELLVENKLAVKITGEYYHDYTSRININTYNIISYYMCKKDKKLKKFLDNNNINEEEIFIDDNIDEKVIKISKYSLIPGTYAIELKENNFIVFQSSKSESDSEFYNYSLYFIGDKCNKNKSKFLKFQSEIFKLRPKYNRQYISYSDGRPVQYTKFKSFDSLILKNKDKIIEYIDNWINSAPLLYKKGIIPKLSILLYGNPGTGKSTFYKALADYLDISEIISISPETFSDNKLLSSACKRYRSTYHNIYGAIYAIDDIDCVCQSRQENSSFNNTKIMSSLLEFLDNPPTFYYKMKDGIYYPISIVVATTNYYDKLDDAVKRYGRFDFQIKLDNFHKEEAEMMCNIFDLTLSDVIPDKKITDKFEISPAKLQALCMENIDKTIKGTI